MRSLRDRLNAVASKPAKQLNTRPAETPFFCREHTVALSMLGGIEETTLEDILSLDPSFSGKDWNARRLLFLDTETTGLSGGAGTVAFEIGVGWIEAGQMIIRQYVMRDYHEEAAMLCEIADLFRRFDTVVSFNGKSFDLPLLESRMTMNRIRLPVTTWPHLDLLHAARRVYKLRLGKCNLARLEAAVLGNEREDDLPGALVPQRYFDYLKTREFALLEDVLAHNLRDVQSLAELTSHLCSVFRHPERLSHPQDMLGVGKTLLRTGNKQKGRDCLRIVGCSSYSAQAHMHLAASYKKGREWSSTISLWEEMISRGENGICPYIELSKYYEHVKKDHVKALSYALRGLNCVMNLALIHGDDPLQQEMLQKRIRRLREKLSR